MWQYQFDGLVVFMGELWPILWSIYRILKCTKCLENGFYNILKD